MLHNGKNLRKLQLHARDGDVGYVHDLLFYDDRWNVRYLVVDTSRWLPGRKVLLIPEILGPADMERQVLPADLTKEQIRNSPDIDTDKPVSRQKEIDLFEYYGWSPYWGGGHGGFTEPVMPDVTADQQELSGATPPGDPHLRSMNAVKGYGIEARDGSIGHLEDVLVDDAAWAVRYLVVDTRNWLPGRKVVVAPSWIQRIAWNDRTVTVDVLQEQIRECPPYDPRQVVDRDYETRLHDYYGRPYYWKAMVRSHGDD